MKLTYKDVRFEVQTYTDKGPTNRFKKGYNEQSKCQKNAQI